VEKSNIKNLLEDIAKGNAFAFAKFYDLYYSKVWTFSHYFTKSEETCKEIVSDVFFNLWQYRRNLPALGNIDGYVYTSIKNLSLRYKRLSERFQLGEVENLSNIQVEAESPETFAINSELKDVLNNSINELPERCKAIFIMVRIDGLSYKEVADIMSISVRTVHAQMIIATKKLIQSIQSVYPNISPGKALIFFFMLKKFYK
jgi:RNA polymerase sigma-70 factor (ECF subfamily)